MDERNIWLGKPIEQLDVDIAVQCLLKNLFVEYDTDIAILSDKNVKSAHFFIDDNLGELFELSIKICRNLEKNLVLVYDASSPPKNININEIDKKITTVPLCNIVNTVKNRPDINRTNNRYTRDVKIEKVEQYVFTNLSQDIREQDVAKIVNFSTTYFSRYFKKHKNISFQDYVSSTRINRAQELLKYDPRQKIAVIAYQIGYSDVSYFNRVFKKHTGMTPTQFRAQTKEKQLDRA